MATSLTLAPLVTMQPAHAEASGYRNLALRRAVAQSSSADYDHTGHLITDGIYQDLGPGSGDGGGQTTATSVIKSVTPANPAFTSVPVKTDNEGVDKLFDHNPDTKWFSRVGPDGTWVAQARFDRSIQALSYSLTTGNDQPTRDPKSWQLQGSTDGQNWTTLDSRSNVTLTSTRKARTVFAVTSPGSYSYYRLLITANGGATDGAQLAELDLMADAAGKVSLIWLNHDRPLSSTAAAIQSGETVDKLFDGDTSTMWYGWDEWGDNTVSAQVWLPQPSIVTSYQLVTSADTPTRDPSSWSLQGSTDDATWVTLDERSGVSPPTDRLANYPLVSLANTVPYEYYRLVLRNNGGSTKSGGGGSKRDYQLAEVRLIDAADRLATTPVTAAAPVFVSTPAKTGIEGVDKLFDSNPYSKWNCVNAAGQWKINVTLDRVRRVASYSLTTAYDDNNWDPTAWHLDGSNDGSTWTQIDSQSGISWGSLNQNRRVKRNYQIANPGAYRYYQLVITATEGGLDSGSPSTQLADVDIYSDAGGVLSAIWPKRDAPLFSTNSAAEGTDVVANLFDGDGSTKWYAWDPWTATMVAQASLVSPARVTSYKLTTANDQPGRDPTSWSLEGSNDGGVWTVLDQKTSVSPPSGRETDYPTFTVATPGTYIHYRLVLTANNGSMHSGSGQTKADYQLSGWDLLVDSQPAVPEDRGPYTDEYNNSPAAETAPNAFDGSSGTKWLSWGIPNWLQVELPAPATAASYVITTANDSYQRDPKVWRVLGSNDGKNFTELDSRNVVLSTSDSGSRYVPHSFDLATTGSYKFYRLAIDQNLGDTGAGDATHPGVPRVQLSEFALYDAVSKPLVSPPSFESFWSSGTATNESVTIDLGGPSTFDTVNLYWRKTRYATAYTISGAVTAAGPWSTLYSTTAGVGGTEQVTLTTPGKDMRLVKLTAQTGSGNRFDLQEMQVMGTGGVVYALPPAPSPEADGRQALTGGNWKVERASQVTGTGATLSQAPADDSAWLPATVPGTVLTSYLRAGAIVDPNIANNQLQISDAYFTGSNWWYRDSFEVPARQAGKRVWLNFDGINWKAEIYVNGHRMGEIDGAYTPGSFDFSDVANYGGTNYLAVLIHKNDNPGAVTVQSLASAGANGGVLGADNPTIHASIGWDWVPTIRGRNIGIYDDVYLTYSGDVTVQNSWTKTHVTNALTDPSADVEIRTEATNASANPVTTTLTGELDGNTLSQDVTLAAHETKEVSLGTVHLDHPRLWWPNTYGDQPLYPLTVTAKVDNKTSDAESIKVGIRELTYTTSGHLVIYCNGVRIIARGGNWGLPDSNMDVSAQDYDTKMRLHAEANLTMIRNWVGMTNDRSFYEAADKYGILIWDDFWLANPGDGPNPNDETMFMNSARIKIKTNRYHASVALYCGRNEGNPPATLNTALQVATTDLDGTRIYIPHSASGLVSGYGPYSVRNPQWYFNNTDNTLHSERGLPNIPTLESMTKMLGPDHLWPQDQVWGLHDWTNSAMSNSGWQNYLASHYATPSSLKQFVDWSQLVNYENHKALFESMYVTGSQGMLMWMSQSAWPSMVWQTYDWYDDTNAGYYAAKLANQPLDAFVDPRDQKVYLSNQTISRQADLKVITEVYGLDGLLKGSAETAIPSIAQDSHQYVVDVPDDNSPGLHFVVTKVFDGRGNELAHDFMWTNPSNYLAHQGLVSLPTASARGSATALVNPSGGQPGDKAVSVKIVNEMTNAPLFMVHLTVWDGHGKEILPAYFSDNYFTVMAGQDNEVRLNIDPATYAGDVTDLVIKAEPLNGPITEIPVASPVTVTSSGHGVASADVTAAVPGATVTLTATPDAGYRLSGWKVTSPRGVTVGDDGTFTMPKAPVSVQAVFGPVTYSISYDIDGGTADNPASYTIESGDITLATPTREGFWTFDGWSGTGIDGVQPAVTIPSGSTGDRSYTARWSPIPPPVAIEPPSVVGVARVEWVVSVDPGRWDTDGVSFAYQWLVDGEPIVGETGARLLVTPVLSGRQIEVVVTASVDGRPAGTATSKPVTVAAVPVWDAKAVYNTGGQVLYGGRLYEALWYVKGQVPGSASGAWQELATDRDGVVLWTASRVFDAGDLARYEGKLYRALWWTRNQVPGLKAGAWEEIATAPGGTAAWTESRVFDTGDRVSYEGRVYAAEWWTRGQVPGDLKGPWKLIG